MTDLGTLPSWNLTDLYPGKDSKELKKDLESVRQAASDFNGKYKNNIASLSPSDLGQAITAYEHIADILGRLSSYAYLQYSENISNSDNTQFYQSIYEDVNTIDSDLLFFALELNNIEEDALAEKLVDDDKLEHFSPWIRDVRALKDYQLSEELEQYSHEKTITSNQSWSRLFDETMARMRFDVDKDTLTLAEVLNLLSSTDGKIRKKAALAISKELENYGDQLALITNVLAKDKQIDDSWRKFASPISSRNVSNLIEDDVVETLISTVKDNYKNLSHRYYSLKAEWMKKDKLDYWDRNAPLPDEDDRIIPWDEARELVLKAYHDFSPTLADIGKEFFDKNWIDAGVKEGKESGAFSHPTVPSAHPYILMNYQGKTRDVMTLAHELGHGIHQVLSADQGALMADTPLTLAETASVFGEQLTFRALLNSTDDDKTKKTMIANKVEDMLNTVVRQIAFCEFETKIHALRKNGEISKDGICDAWMSVQSESLGPAIRFDDSYRYYWSYIPHFIHSPFYVYSYAFGDCLVNSLYRVYQQQPEGFEEKYIDMLKAGGTLRHKELLEPFGLDATQQSFWQGGLDVIGEFIDGLG